MSKKNERSLTSALGGGESVRTLRKAIKKVFKSSDDKIGKVLESITSIQACKDAALTGDDDLRLLAVCRLGEYGIDGLESLDIALNDDNAVVRAVAAAMIAAIRSTDGLELLEAHANDNDETARTAIEYSIAWLKEKGEELGEAPKTIQTDNPLAFLLDDDATPLRTVDDVIVLNEYATLPENLEFGITVKNESQGRIHDVSVQILAYPEEGMKAVDELEQNIECIEPGDSGVLIFGFSISGDCIEGEIITSVTFYDKHGENLAAKSGNVFIRSLFEQMVPLEASQKEFLELKKGMKTWNREHMLAKEAKEVFVAVSQIMEDKNLSILQTESTQKKKTFMGIISGMAQNRFSENRIAITITVLGDVGDDLSKVRLDVFSDNNEILHSIASDFFERIQEDLGVLEN